MKIEITCSFVHIVCTTSTLYTRYTPLEPHNHIREPFVCISIDFDLHKPEELIFFCSWCWFCSTFFLSRVAILVICLKAMHYRLVYGTCHNTRDANCRCLHTRLYEIDCALIRRLEINYTQISIKIRVPIPQTQHTLIWIVPFFLPASIGLNFSASYSRTLNHLCNHEPLYRF